MTHEARPSRRDFLVTTAAGTAGVFLGQESIQGSNQPPQPCRLTGIPTGFQQIDSLIGGLHRNELVLLASRPGIGKTALALNFADYVSVEAVVPTLYLSLGTSGVEIARRLMCSRGEVCHTAMRHRTVSSDVGQRLTQAAAEHRQGHMYLDDQPLQTVPAIRALAERLNERLVPQHLLGFLVVDHLQRVEAEHHGQTLNEHLIDVAYELRNLAHELNVAILGLMQLNCPRSIALGAAPALGELCGTQYAADVVMLLHRLGSNLALSDAQKHGLETRAQLSVIRRNDRLAETVELSWNTQYTRFSEPAARL